jgi:hypothetical protein
MHREVLMLLLRTFVHALLLATSVFAAPPRVVQAIPDDGQKDVDAATVRDIRVTFDQPMDTGGGWSIVGGGDTFPAMLGRPKWASDRQLVIHVKLEPGHDYWLSINSDNFGNFRSRKGESAVPYPIGFSTRPGAAAVNVADDNRHAVEILRECVDGWYAHRDQNKLDWDKAFAKHSPAMLAAKTPEEFAQAAAKLLGENDDLHVFVQAGDKTFGSTRARYVRNYNLATLQRSVPQWTDHGGVFTGEFAAGGAGNRIAYLCIPGWNADNADALEAAYALLADTKQLIIDVRPNGGGDEPTAARFAGCFVSEPRTYAKNTIRLAGFDQGPFDRTLEPNQARPHFDGKCVVLMGRGNMSSNESFLLMMRQAGATLVGDRSYGASGNPKPFDLGNGVTAYLSSWNDLLPDGTPLEGKGVRPDVTVETTPQQLEKTDAVLEAALKILREK